MDGSPYERGAGQNAVNVRILWPGGAGLLLFALGALLVSGGRDTAPAGPVLAVAGDVSLARGVAAANASDWPAALAAVAPALRADVAAANLESPLTTTPRQTPGIDLRAPPAGVAALAPFTHLGTENNHARDGGPAGQAQSQGALRAAGVVPVTRTPTLSRVGGERVAFVAYLDDGRTPPPLAAIRAAAHGAWVVVLPHWGEEYGLTTARQRAQARALVAAGATVVAGSGPHVLQGHEVLRGPRGPALVLYSLGNLLFDQALPATRVGAVVRVPLRQVGAACAVPTRIRAGRVGPATGEDRRTALRRLGLPPC
ncbi:CapA family protein [Deinococcus aquaedulcis]|uniref:CapA family protein n=1 Tax=Deinococcus aquaedulcis TaxID=2840455 RepID=UPI001C83D474|nr:CapA family protein [Deinococcus aquaedulcis]